LVVFVPTGKIYYQEQDMLRRLPFSLTRAAALTLGAGLVASCATFVGVSRLEYDKLALSFAQGAEQRVATVRQGLHDAVEVLTVTNQLFKLGAPVTRAQFHDFTSPLLQRHPYIKAFNYHRQLTHAERAAVESALQAVVPGSFISEERKGRMIPAAPRPRYNIVEYLEPMAGNENAFGFDSSTREPINTALARSHAEGRAIASALFPLVQDDSPQPSFQLILPVYDAGGRLVGDTAVVVRARELVRTTLAKGGLLDANQLEMSVYAGQRAQPADLVFSTSAGSARPLPDLLGSLVAPHYKPSMTRTLEVAGRPWLVEVAQQPRSFVRCWPAASF
jgi:CHASE1-domain containing sensor protein